MINYDPGKYQLRFIFSLHGSVIPRACAYAVPSGLLAVALKVLDMEGIIPDEASGILSNNAAYAGFSFVVGFLLVFRTSQAYSRFWDGATTVQQMQSKWCDACGSLVAFSHKSKKPAEQVQHFQHVLVRLFSLLHSLALQQIHDLHDESFEVIDLQGLDGRCHQALRACAATCRVELVSCWIHQLIVDNIDTGIMPAPPPIQSRVFQEMSNGSLNMHNAYKIAKTPFPFPYAQMTTVLLLAHWILTPVLMCSWTQHWAWAFIWTFTPVLSFWCIDLIASEIEQPFGADVNDLPTHELQAMMNESLLLLINPQSGQVPTLTSTAVLDWDELEYTYVTQVHIADQENPQKGGKFGDLDHADSVAQISRSTSYSSSSEKHLASSRTLAFLNEGPAVDTQEVKMVPVSVETSSSAQQSAETQLQKPNVAEPQVTDRPPPQPDPPKVVSNVAPAPAPAPSLDPAPPSPVPAPTTQLMGSSDVGSFGRKDAALRLQELNLQALQRISNQLGFVDEGMHVMRAIVTLLEDARSPSVLSGSPLRPIVVETLDAPAVPGSAVAGSNDPRFQPRTRAPEICGRLSYSCGE